MSWLHHLWRPLHPPMGLPPQAYSAAGWRTMQQRPVWAVGSRLPALRPKTVIGCLILLNTKQGLVLRCQFCRTNLRKIDDCEPGRVQRQPQQQPRRECEAQQHGPHDDGRQQRPTVATRPHPFAGHLANMHLAGMHLAAVHCQILSMSHDRRPAHGSDTVFRVA